MGVVSSGSSGFSSRGRLDKPGEGVRGGGEEGRRGGGGEGRRGGVLVRTDSYSLKIIKLTGNFIFCNLTHKA